MTLVLIGLGLALVTFGALVLLRFPNRPGGAVRLLGLEVSSVGAGLPVIALGVLVVALAVTERRDEAQSASSDGSGGGGQVAGPPPDDTPACVDELFARKPRVPAKRQRALWSAREDVEVLAGPDFNRDPFGLVLVDSHRRKVVGAVKLSYDDEPKLFSIHGLVDARCRSVRWTSPGQSGLSPRLINQLAHLDVTLDGNRYDIELKPNSAIVEMELHSKGS